MGFSGGGGGLVTERKVLRSGDTKFYDQFPVLGTQNDIFLEMFQSVEIRTRNHVKPSFVSSKP